MELWEGTRVRYFTPRPDDRAKAFPIVIYIELSRNDENYKIRHGK
jgi:hypothetical protein